MKKTFITALAISAGVLAFSACQKDLTDTENSQTATITRTVTVSDEEWTGDTKTAFVEGEGIKVTGTENMSVFYYDGTKETTVSGLAKTVATPDGKGNFTFSHDATEGNTYNYWFVLPNTTRNKETTDAHTFWLYPTQHPAADSFDPNMDCLVGQAQFGLSAQSSIEGLKFRRLFSHLKLELTDGASVLGDEKIHIVTFAVNTTPDKATALTGIVYPVHSDVYSDPQNTMETPGNAVTAHYGDGLAKKDGKYPVWYVVNPTEIAAETDITITVTADTKTLTRTVTLPAAGKIEKGKINVIPFDISGTGYSVTESAYYNFSVASISDLPSAWAAGTTTEIKTDNTDSYYPNSLYLAAKKSTSSITYTVPEGKTVKGVNLYIHPQSPNANTGLLLTCNETECGTFNLNYAADGGGLSGYRYFYNGMSTKYQWPDNVSTIKFAASNSSTYRNSLRFVDAVVLFKGDE